MARIFVVEDDLAITTPLIATLKKWQHTVATVQSWDNVTAEAVAFNPALITMDITLPTYDGFYWTTQLHQALPTVPIIFLTAATTAEAGSRAIAAGASDFIEKPLTIDYLLAKINLLLQNPATNEVIRGAYTFNPVTNQLTCGATSIRVTPTEGIILRLLLTAAPEPVMRSTLVSALWSADVFINDDALTTNVSRLRKKVAVLGGTRAPIETVRGVGYRWND